MPHLASSDRTQVKMLSLEEMVQPDSVCRAIDAFVEALKLEKLGFDVTAAATGRAAYHPSMFLKLYLYGYMNRIRSSRKLEAECRRNIELMWLLGELTPAYHTIADFRSKHGQQIRNVFKTLVLFSKGQGLIAGKLVAIDGTKVRAMNSKKNNYNIKKIDRHIEYIDNKLQEYMVDLDQNDKSENDSNGQITKRDLKQAVDKLKERRKKYTDLADELNKTGQDQISTTDPDAKQMIIRGTITEVAYNLQAAVDDKNNLVVHYEATQKNDRNALHGTAGKAKEILGVKALEVLADKGYHNGGQLDKCAKDNIITYVPAPEHVHNTPVPAPEYLVENFIYNEETDSYSCPQHQTLTTNGSWYSKHRDKHNYKVKHYKTSSCATCPARASCTINKSGRLIERSEFQKSVDANNRRVVMNREKYNRRQCINEHVFGIIKRQWGYDHTLMKGLKNVDAETGLIFTAFNIRRILNIFGTKKFIRRIRRCFTNSLFQLKKALYNLNKDIAGSISHTNPKTSTLLIYTAKPEFSYL